MRGSLADEQSICLKIQQKTSEYLRELGRVAPAVLFRLQIPRETLVTMKRNTAPNDRLSHFAGALVAIAIQTSSLIDLFAFLMGQREGGISEGLGPGKRLTPRLLTLLPHAD